MVFLTLTLVFASNFHFPPTFLIFVILYIICNLLQGCTFLYEPKQALKNEKKNLEKNFKNGKKE